MASTYTVKAGDTLNGIAAKYGFSNYKTAGISGYGSNPDKIGVGTVLTIGGVKSPTPTPTPSPAPTGGTSTPDATSLINGGQKQDQKDAASLDAPTVSSGAQSLIDSYKALATAIAPTSSKPTAPSLTETYNGLRSSMGVDTLEASLNDLNAQANQLKSKLYTQQLDEQGKPVALNVISGRMTEEQRQAAEKLQPLTDQIAAVNAQLTTKYNVISSLMTYTQQDYANAKDTYDTQLSQNLSMIQLAKGVQDTANTEAEQQKDDARANLQIIYNNVAASGGDISSLDANTKTTITKLELQAGLPQGFYESIVGSNPKSDILSTTTRDSGGIKYADVIVRNADGSLSTQTVKLGASTSGSNPTEADKTKADATTVTSQLNSVSGSDGYVSPSDYLKARKAWVNAGYTADDFDSRFAKTYVNPTQYTDAGVSVKYTT